MMKNTKKMSRFSSRVMLFLMVLVLTASSCSGKVEEKMEADGIHNLYMFYTNANFTTLSEHLVSFRDEDTFEQKVAVVMDAIQNPPEGLHCIIPEGITLTWEIEYPEDDSIVIDQEDAMEPLPNILLFIRGSYDSLSANTANVFRIGVIKSLLRIQGVGSISLFKGKLPNLENRISFVASSDTVIVNESDENFFKDTVSIKLYFINENGDKLVAETRKIMIQMSESVPTKIVEQLIKGPDNPSHKNAIPLDTAVNEIMMRNNVCYVDLNEAFVRNHIGGELNEMLTVYSIVNSITQQYGVDSVQILIGGQQREYYKNYVKINTPLYFNEELISD